MKSATLAFTLVAAVLFIATAIKREDAFYLIPAVSFLVAAGAMWLRRGHRQVEATIQKAVGDKGKRK